MLSSRADEEYPAFDDDEDALEAAASTRSAKRRRLNGPRDDDALSSPPQVPSSSSNTLQDSFIDDEAIEDMSEVEDDLDLPPLPQDRGSDYEEELNSPQRKSRYKIHVNKHSHAQENIFVTQLTQPPSSPSRIRGPRWKKPNPNENGSRKPSSGGLPLLASPDPDDGLDAADIEAAIAASKNYGPARQHSSTKKTREQSGPQARRPSVAKTPCAELPEIDVDDLPSDAFASSSVSQETYHNQPFNILSQSPTRTQHRANDGRKAMRQTTLFGGSARTIQIPASQGRAHNWPLSNRNEAPTHHTLDEDALKTWVYPTNLGKVRDYQFNIVQRGLFHNLLVALPTGLGKTFIAATIMLNWFRWTKDAQIVFVAPTKPLVSQQVEACFNVVGIPRRETTMLTGHVQPALRAEEWQTKRVFFMTPQTLQHDLTSGICDPKRIVLLVVDEAHRATGGYAYVEVVKFLRRFNTSFRVLGLTATPGASVEAVQEVIDGLDIARVEIRTEESLDIREYSHVRNIEMEIFEYTDEMTMAMDLFSRALQPIVNKLNSLNAYWGKDPMSLTAYGLTVARRQWMGSDAAKGGGWALKGMANAIFNVLASLAHAIDLLKFHGIGPFYRNLLNFRNGMLDGEKEKGSKYQKQIAGDEHFKKLMTRLQAWINDPEFVGHPKLSYLKSVVLNHFMDAGEGRGAAHGRPPSDTRIMIFCHYRDSAEEVVRVLKMHEPMIRPHVFVGQAGTKGSEGMNQKTQLEIVDKFKKGTYNTIVATSIGEEGLDIGEVDLIVCYDSSASPIRMLQRMGRTGRKRAGNIVLLLMKGKEEDSYVKAKDNYEKMQQMIASGSRFVFHDDRSPRILPREAQPVVDKRRIEIPLENSQLELPQPRKRGRPPKKPPKKFHMPDGVITGFMKASRLDDEDNSEGESDDALLGLVSKPSSNSKKKQKTSVPMARKPALDETPIEPSPLASVLLSPAEEQEWREQYCNVGGTKPQYVSLVRIDAFPKLQRRLRGTVSLPHGRVTASMVKAVKNFSSPITSDFDLDIGQEVLDELVGITDKRSEPGRSILEGPTPSSSQQGSVSGKKRASPQSRPRIHSSSSTPSHRRRASTQETTPAIELDTATQESAALPSFSQMQQANEPSKTDQASKGRKRMNVLYSDSEEDKDDEELPDLSAMIGSRKNKPAVAASTVRRKGGAGTRRRRIIDDDDDDDSDR